MAKIPKKSGIIIHSEEESVVATMATVVPFSFINSRGETAFCWMVANFDEDVFQDGAPLPGIKENASSLAELKGGEDEERPCPDCGHELRYAIGDKDGTNLVEGFECPNCGWEGPYE